MIDAILFPCEMFSMNKVDSCFKGEFDAVSKNSNFKILFYNYEEFAENGNLRLCKKVENPVSAMLRGWMLNGEQYKWLTVFKEYRSKLFTGGICIKEYVD